MSLYPRPYTYLYKIEIKWVKYSAWEKPPNPTKPRYVIATSTVHAKEVMKEFITECDLTDRKMVISRICNVNELEEIVNSSKEREQNLLATVWAQNNKISLLEKELEKNKMFPLSNNISKPRRNWLYFFRSTI